MKRILFAIAFFILAGTSMAGQTYSAAVTYAPAASGTDSFVIFGSATQNIYITKLEVSATATALAKSRVELIKRSTATSGGTPVTITSVAHKSTNDASTATIYAYTANPTPGTAVGPIRAVSLTFSEATTNVSGDTGKVWDFTKGGSQPIYLLGTSQCLALNLLGATPSGAVFSISIEYEIQ